ncbi:MAG: hypothetical protein AB9869_09930 [Verrucomicrobiia bacterium]
MRVISITSVTVLLSAMSQICGQVRELDSESAHRIAGQLFDVDFEGLSAYQFGGTPGAPVLPNPLKFDGLTLSHPFSLGVGFCSTPTCEADPDNPQGGNIEAFLNPNATLAFSWSPSVVILDVQGMGANPFTLEVIDGSGEREAVSGRGVLFGVSWVALTSTSGIDTIKVNEVGGSGGPMVIARVLYSQVPEPSAVLLFGLGVVIVLFSMPLKGAGGSGSLSGQPPNASTTAPNRE